MKGLAILTFTAALAASSANAQILLTDNFNTENGGASSLNYIPFANWTVVGQVDLVAQGFAGIGCVGGSGACVDLDGSGGPGKLVGKTAFSFSSGEIFRISFDISGNQRGSASDVFELGLNFGAGATVGPVVGTGGLSSFTGAGPGIAGSISYSVALNAGDPFSTWSLQFLAQSAGTVRYSLGTTSGDNIGPVLDNVVVQRVTPQAVVPEPSTWAMVAFGLGGLGVAARRRVRKV